MDEIDGLKGQIFGGRDGGQTLLRAKRKEIAYSCNMYYIFWPLSLFETFPSLQLFCLLSWGLFLKCISVK